MPQEPCIVRSFSQKVPVFFQKVPLFRAKQGDFFRRVHCRRLSLLVRMSGRRYINKESVKLSATLAADSGVSWSGTSGSPTGGVASAATYVSLAPKER